jgi:hypothetical protein
MSCVLLVLPALLAAEPAGRISRVSELLTSFRISIVFCPLLDGFCPVSMVGFCGGRGPEFEEGPPDDEDDDELPDDELLGEGRVWFRLV